MSGKLIGGAIVGIALIAGIAIYYLQVYAYYEEVPEGEVTIALTLVALDTPEPVMAENLRVIDSDSSPLRFRACFELSNSLAMLTETYRVYPAPEPLNAPSWFDCFDAPALGAALKSGEAIAFLGEAGIHDGVDRVVAVFDDGRAYAWHQLNDTWQD